VSAGGSFDDRFGLRGAGQVLRSGAGEVVVRVSTPAWLAEPADHAVRVVDLDRSPLLPGFGATPVALGAMDVAAYRVTLAAGQRVALRLDGAAAPSNGDGVALTLVGPDGSVVLAPRSAHELQVFEANASGSWVVVLQRFAPSGSEARSYTLVVEDASDVVREVALPAEVSEPPVFVAGLVGQALALPGFRAVEVADAPVLREIGDQTIGLWLRPDPAVTGAITGLLLDKSETRETGEEQIAYRLEAENGRVIVTLDSGQRFRFVTAAPVLERGSGAHLALVINRASGSVVLYVNGAAASLQTVSGLSLIHISEPTRH